MVWLALAAVAGLVAVSVRYSAAAHRWRWRERSLEARLRDQSTRREAYEKTVARLRRDYDAGALEISGSYRGLFERLTGEARSES